MVESSILPFDTDIHFIVPVPDWQPEHATPLQGFSYSLCENAHSIRIPKFFPTNIYEFTEEGIKNFLARRMAGLSPINLFPQSVRAIKSVPWPELVPFAVILLGEDADITEYKEWASQSKTCPIFVAKKGGDIDYPDFNFENLQKKFIEACDRLPKEIDPSLIKSAKDAIENWKSPAEKKLAYQVGGHASISPNLAALFTAGYVEMVSGRFNNLGDGLKPYIEQIVLTSNSVFDERNRIGQREAHRIFRLMPDLNLFAPCIYPSFFSDPLPAELNGKDRKIFRSARTILEQQSGYGYVVKTEDGHQAMLGFKGKRQPDTPEEFNPHPLLRIRQRELALNTSVVELLSASEISATLRLPNDINRTLGTVRQFASQYRSSNNSSRKRVLAFRTVQERLARAFPVEFYDLISRSESGIRVISDAHLEWLNINGMPLCLSKNVSRIPVTPGNLFIEQCGAKSLLRLTPEHFQDILVIRALKKDDPIKKVFEVAFDIFEKEWRDKLNVEFIEVSNKDELIAALDAFRGAVVIFDGHGSHENDKPAYLHLMDTAVDVWELQGKIKRPPPIVILSACDTHAADRNHATTASGFLSIGVRAVLASVFPLDALSAATFSARLLHRIANYIPVAVKMFGQSLTWVEVVSGMIRMQLLTDFLRAMEVKNIITSRIYRDAHMEGNTAINAGHDEPFEDVIKFLIKQGMEEVAIRRELEIAIANSSAISYLNMGRPETILIDTEERLKAFLDED